MEHAGAREDVRAVPARAVAVSVDLAGSVPDAGEPLSAYLDGWLSLQTTQLQPGTWTSYAGTLRRYVRPHLGEVPLDRVHARQLTALYAHLLTHGGRDGGPLSLRTVRYVHRILHKALVDACRDGVLERNPSDGALLPRLDPARGSEVPRLQVWTAEELRRFLAATADTRHGPVWAVAAGTGMRRGELLGLRWSDVDLDQRLLWVRVALTRVRGAPALKTPKSGRARRLRIDAYTVDALRDQQARQAADARRLGQCWRNDLDLVFTTETGQPWHPDAVTRAFGRACVDAGVRRIRLHDVRHTAASLMLGEGVPVKVVSERLGHASATLTLEVYSHVLPTMDDDAVARFAALVHSRGRGIS